MLLNHTCDIQRLAAMGTNGRKVMQTVTESVRCLVLPMGSNTTIQNGLQLGRGYEVHLGPNEDIKTGDRLLWNGTRLSVRYVRDYRNVPPVSHFEAVCEQEVT